MSAQATIIAASNLWFAYGGAAPVLRGVSLRLEPGSLTMILGRSGSGKTTLLRILAGLLSPQQGRVTMAASMNGATGPTHGRTVAYIPQTLGLVRSLSALENVLTGALSATGTMRSLLGWFAPPVVSRAQEILSRLGLDQKLREPVCRLSGGERQRVAIARALILKPRLILADEFVSQLDAATAREILTMIRGLTVDGTTLLMTTHEADFVTQYADRVAIMRKGLLMQEQDAARFSAKALLEQLQ